MDRVYLSGALQTKPDVSALTSKGYPTDGNPGTGIAPTVPGAGWAYMIMEELLGVIEAAGITPEKTSLDQLKKAIPIMVPKLMENQALAGEKLKNGTVSIDALKNSVFATLENAKNGTPRLIVTSDVLLSFVQFLIPAGVTCFYAGKSVPDGWLACNGAVYPRSKYPRLFAAIGTTYGAGDGSTTFAIPKAHHQVLEATSTISEVGQVMQAGLPDITGQQLLWGYPVMTGSAGALGYAGSKLHPINASLSDETTETYSDITFAASRSVATFGKAETVQPSAIRLLAIIRT